MPVTTRSRARGAPKPIVRTAKVRAKKTGEQQKQQPQKRQRKKKKRETWSDARILRRYTTPGEGAAFTSADKLAREIPVEAARIRSALATSRALQQHTPYRRTFRRRKIRALPWHYMSLDLKDLSALAPHNDGHKWLLFALDLATRYLHVRAMRSKRADDIVVALEDVFRAMKERGQPLPRVAVSDRGGEFVAARVRRLFETHGIRPVLTSDPEVKASSVERVIRTLTGSLYKFFTLNNTYAYVDRLQDFVRAYNNTVHSATGLRPAETTSFDGADIFLRTHGLRVRPPARSQFRAGDSVFVFRHKRTFTKGYTPNLTGEIFTVDRVLERTDPVTYRLRDAAGELVDGSFYAQELVKTTPPAYYEIEEVLDERRSKKKKGSRGGGREYLVKWLYYPSSFNSWVPATDLVTFKGGRGELDAATRTA